ncbi:microcompartment protein [Embleya hyalina]|uniref:BMC circularly permuted domain-containing protein n=1 Tax=Embleya hyalina TaxID=516124 RepID=A0A401YEE5_9ACTN|nr:microcompartment protein [Embleya hyalina]GCD92963.1 hypothetical protein EHYA_00606 [Embleya hyalina]
MTTTSDEPTGGAARRRPRAAAQDRTPAPDRAAAPAAPPQPAAPATELRVYLTLRSLQRQFAAYLGTPTRARGYPPLEGDHALIIEVAPGLAIERVIDLALKAVPAAEPGLLFVERQFGILELHTGKTDDLERAGAAIQAGIRRSPADQLKPRLLYTDVIEDVTDQHAVILNRTRQASMILPGQTLLVMEMTPALYAALAANEAERAAPKNTLVDVQMIGAAGRVYISGTLEDVTTARHAIDAALAAVEGRDH